MTTEELFEMKLHQSVLVTVEVLHRETDPLAKVAVCYPVVWQVTRVATGWIYQDANPNVQKPQIIFVPLTTYSSPNV